MPVIVLSGASRRLALARVTTTPSALIASPAGPRLHSQTGEVPCPPLLRCSAPTVSVFPSRGRNLRPSGSDRSQTPSPHHRQGNATRSQRSFTVRASIAGWKSGRTAKGQWLKAQDTYPRATLANIRGREKFLARVKELDAAGTIWSTQTRSASCCGSSEIRSFG